MEYDIHIYSVNSLSIYKARISNGLEFKASNSLKIDLYIFSDYFKENTSTLKFEKFRI